MWCVCGVFSEIDSAECVRALREGVTRGRVCGVEVGTQQEDESAARFSRRGRLHPVAVPTHTKDKNRHADDS
jgi:hypothetical protein